MLTNGLLGLLGLSATPPTILEHEDLSGEEWKRECLAWSLLKRRNREEIKDYLDKVKNTHGDDFYNDIRARLNKLRLIVKARRAELSQATAS